MGAGPLAAFIKTEISVDLLGMTSPAGTSGRVGQKNHSTPRLADSADGNSDTVSRVLLTRSRLSEEVLPLRPTPAPLPSASPPTPTVPPKPPSTLPPRMLSRLSAPLPLQPRLSPSPPSPPGPPSPRSRLPRPKALLEVSADPVCPPLRLTLSPTRSLSPSPISSLARR